MVPDDVVASFNERASTYDDSALHQWMARSVADFLDFELGDVLDVATGTGLVLRAIADRSSTLTGVDVALSMLDVARRALPDAVFKTGRAEALPFDRHRSTPSCVSVLCRTSTCPQRRRNGAECPGQAAGW